MDFSIKFLYRVDFQLIVLKHIIQVIKMTCKYTVTNMGKNLLNKSINKRGLIKVE